MNNEKSSTSLHQEFVRKPKRRQSPKHKNQNLYNFKYPHKENINAKQKEEYHLNQNNLMKNDTEIVLDLKQQLSHLKQQVAKIAHSKLQSAQMENNTSKVKMLDYYFPDKNDKKSDLTSTNVKTEISKTQTNELSLDKQMNKLKSKERLKFSKLKKVDKFSPVSATKKKQVEGSAKSIQSEQLIKQQEPKRKKSGDESTLEEDIKKITMQHKNRLEQKINTLVFDQQNISININRENSIKQSKQSNSSLGVRGKQVVSPRGSTQVRINRLRQKVQQQDGQILALKKDIKEKNDSLIKYEKQLQQLRLQKHTQEVQVISLRKQLTNLIEDKKTSETNIKKLKQLINQLQQQNTKHKQQLDIVSQQLKNRQLQIIKIQGLNQNLSVQINNIKIQNNKLIDSLRKQYVIRQSVFLEEINKANKIIKELKVNTNNNTNSNNNNNNNSNNNNNIINNKNNIINNKPKQLTLTLSHTNQPTNTTTKSPKQEQTLAIPSPNSPRGNITPTNRQRQMLNVIRLHQKSLQNYQKDLAFLQSQCKNLHQFKILAKKQQNLIKETNHILINQQLIKLNAKYQKKPLSFSPALKQLPKKLTKQKINEQKQSQ